LAASFASFFFYFSASRVINTYSSFGGLKGEKFSDILFYPTFPLSPLSLSPFLVFFILPVESSASI
jgi:hypothetical protein